MYGFIRGMSVPIQLVSLASIPLDNYLSFQVHDDVDVFTLTSLAFCIFQEQQSMLISIDYLYIYVDTNEP
jgi:hypothetical protein